VPGHGQVSQTHGGGGTSNREWWPNQLNLKILHQHSSRSDPMGKGFNYAEAFKSLDLNAVKKDLLALMTDSQDWWPAGLRALRAFVHPDGMAQRRQPTDRRRPRRRRCRPAALRSSQQLADNVNLDKARRLLWPIKRKYGRKISWADLMISRATSPWNRWIQDVRFRRRAGGCMGAGRGRLLGFRDHLAG